MRRATKPLALLMLLAGCAGHVHGPATAGAVAAKKAAAAAPPVEEGWRGIATVVDKQRLDAMPATWEQARAAVPKLRRPRLSAEGPLVEADAALDMPALPPGPYHCRLIRFGGRHGFASFAPDFCYVEVHGDAVSFTKQTGSNLPQGWLYPDSVRRQIFLGTLRNKATTGEAKYGVHPEQDVAGIVERVSPFRWRLTLARSARDGLLDIYELVPVTPEVPGAKAAVPS